MEYLRLQYTILNRRLTDFGITPFWGYVLLMAVFLVGSFFLFSKGAWAGYAYMLIALALVSQLSEVKRNLFLKICFNADQHRRIRIVENSAAALPFALFLLLQKQWILAPALLFLSIALVFLQINTDRKIIIPVPFQKPFEFTTGFRNTFLGIIIAYALAFIAVWADNFNLGMFTILLIFVLVFTYYAKMEPRYLVWCHALTVNGFLWEKISTGILYATAICLPVIGLLGAFYPAYFHFLLIGLLIGHCYLTMIILAKYAAYPNSLNVPQGIFISTSIYFPPMLIVIIPWLYNRCKKQLINVLMC